MAIGLGLSILTAAVAFIIVSQVNETILFKTEESAVTAVLASFFFKGFAANILPIIATGLAFFAKPVPVPVKVVCVTTQASKNSSCSVRWYSSRSCSTFPVDPTVSHPLPCMISQWPVRLRDHDLHG